jgi:hypothetical protein
MRLPRLLSEVATREYLRHELEDLSILLADLVPKTQANSLLRRVTGCSDALRNPAQDHIRHCATSVTRVMYGDQVHEATEPTRNSNRQDT